MYDQRADFEFVMVNFPILDGDVPCATSCSVYISQLICIARPYGQRVTLIIETNF